MSEKEEDYYIESDRCKRYLDSLMMQLAVKSIGGNYTKVYKEKSPNIKQAEKILRNGIASPRLRKTLIQEIKDWKCENEI